MAPSSTLKIIKLTNNEELIGIVQDGRDFEDVGDGFTTENLLFITAPLKIITQYDSATRTHSLYLSDWCPAIVDDHLPIDKRNVLTLGTPTQSLEEHYYELIIASQLAKEEERQSRGESSVKELDEPEELKKLRKLLKDHKFDDDDLQ